MGGIFFGNARKFSFFFCADFVGVSHIFCTKTAGSDESSLGWWETRSRHKQSREGETQYPPAHLIEPLAKALKVSTDELLGVKIIKQQRDPQHAALRRRLKKIESLPKRD